MEPVTHFLTGAVLARAGFNRKTALATATMTLAAEAPDLDVLSSFKGPVYGFAHHRGFTHSFVGLILMSAIVTGFMYLVWRLRGRKTNIPNLPPRWGLLFLFAYIAGLSHILLDFTNNYGVRPFWPFSERWYSWGVAFIFEPPIFLLLLAALVLPFLWRASPLQSFRGSVLARGALILVVALWLFRSYEADKVVRTLSRKEFNSESPASVSAYPYWTRVSGWRIGLRWAAIVETPSFFVIADVNPRSQQLDANDKVVIHKPAETRETLAAKQSYLGRVYLDWAKYPLVSITKEGTDWVVRFRDLRFGYPQLNRDSLLTASVNLDAKLRVIGEFMGSRQQVPPID